MSEYMCLLLHLLSGDGRIFRVAVKIHRDDEDDFVDDPVPFLPLHCQGHEVLQEETIELFEVVQRERGEREAGSPVRVNSRKCGDEEHAE